MPTPYDHRVEIVAIEALKTIVQIHVSRLTDFFDEGEMNFTIRLDDLKDEADQVTPERWDEIEEYFLDRRDNLEALLELNKHFSIVGLFTAFEIFLRNTLVVLHWPDPVAMECVREMRFDDRKKVFAKLGVTITKPDRDWQKIQTMKAVRNCITHTGGRPDKKTAEKLAKHNISVVQSQLEIPKGYVGESIRLVERASERIAKDCQRALREGRVKIEWPTVAGLMDSLLERPEGVTWSGLSRMAQALVDKLGYKTKMTPGVVRAHARFRDQQATGRWGNLKLEEFEDKSGGHLIDKS